MAGINWPFCLSLSLATAGVKYLYLFCKKVNRIVSSKLSNFRKVLGGAKRCPKVFFKIFPEIVRNISEDVYL